MTAASLRSPSTDGAYQAGSSPPSPEFALAAEPRHADADRLVRLRREGPEAHGRADETAHDPGGCLHLLERHAGTLLPKRHQVAWLARSLLIEQLAVGGQLAVGRDGRLERLHHLRRVGVGLPAAAEADEPGVLEGRCRRSERAPMPGDDHLPELLRPDRSRPVARRGEAALHEAGTEADHVEDLPAPVRGQGADPHPCQDLAQALLQRGDRVPPRLAGLEILGSAFACGLRGQLQHQPRMNRRCANRHEHREVVDVERVTGLDGHVGPRATAGRDELLVHAADREDRWDRHPAWAGGAVRQHDEPKPSPRCRPRLPCQPRQPEPEPACPTRGRPGGVEHRHPAHRAEQLRPALVVEDRGVDDDRVGRVRRRCQEIRPATDSHGQRHDGALALRVDRRIRDLGKRLAQERRDATRPARQRRDRRVVAHAPDRLVRLGRHRPDDLLHDLGVQPERDPHPFVGRGGVWRAARHQAARDAALRRLVPLDGRPDDPAVRDVDQHHLARAQPTPMRHAAGRQLNAPRLRGDHDEPVARRRQRQGTQPVAVEQGADPPSVAEDECGGAVPGLASGERRIQGRAAEALGRRDERSDRVVDAHAGQDQQLERIVERLRVGPDIGDKGADVGQPPGPSASAEGMSPAAHRFAIRPHRVDLAVVGEIAERLCQAPRRERVRRVALVEDGVPRVEVVGAKVVVEAPELVTDEEALVDDLPRADRRNGDRCVALDRPAQDRELSSEGQRRQASIPDHDRLPDYRRLANGAIGHQLAPDRHVPPAGDRQPLVSGALLDELDGRIGVVVGQEAHRHGDPAARASGQSRLGQEPCAEAGRDGDGDAGAVAGAVVGGPCASVCQRGQRLEGHRHRVRRMAAVNVGDEPDSACVVLVPWVIERRVDRLKSPGGHRSSSPLRGCLPR